MARHTTTGMDKLTPTAQERRPKWLSYAQAAELSTLSVRSLKRLTATGALPCYVVGGKVLRLRASDVEALIVPVDSCDVR